MVTYQNPLESSLVKAIHNKSTAVKNTDNKNLNLSLLLKEHAILVNPS